MMEGQQRAATDARAVVRGILDMTDADMVTVPRRALAVLLAIAGEEPAPLFVDLTVAEVARALGRGASTVRGWCEAGRFAGAYRLNQREWRIPRSALEHFLATARTAPPSATTLDLSAWRRVQRPAA